MEQKREEPDFNYESLFNFFRLILNPFEVFDVIHSQEVICDKCKKIISIKFKQKCITIKCNCGIGILYPPRADRGGKYLYTHISKHKYDPRRQLDGNI